MPSHNSTTSARPFITGAIFSSNNLLRARQKEDELLFVMYLITPIDGIGGLFCFEIFFLFILSSESGFCVHSDT